MKKCIIEKITHEEGDSLFLVETWGSGPAWSKDKEDAKIFGSISNAQDTIKWENLHGAKIKQV